MTKFYAHSLEGKPPEEWQLLEDHLKNVAERAEGFAKFFGGEKWTYLAGKSHDLGKGTLPWQAFLRHANGIVDELSRFYEGHPTHADVGAQWLFQNSNQVGKMLAYCIAGHHGGLPNWSDNSSVAELNLV